MSRSITFTDLGLVVLGGAAGTLTRYGVYVGVAAVAPSMLYPLGTLGVNIIGAFLLGFLVERLARFDDTNGRRRGLRLLLGTGVLGGFTTYSTLAVDAAGLLVDGHWGLSLGYAALTLVVGGAASLLGISTAGGLHREVRS